MNTTTMTRETPEKAPTTPPAIAPLLEEGASAFWGRKLGDDEVGDRLD
jgi:hypothetical protein